MLEQFLPLTQDAVRRKFSSGATILYQGEVPRSACIVVSGVIRVVCISSAGDEQIVLFQVAGEIFPIPWIFGKATSTLFFYEAVTDCEIAFVPKADFMAFMQADNTRMMAMIDFYATNYAASMIHVNALEQPRAKDKLLYTLYYLCMRYGLPASKKVQIPLKLTHQNLASLVGLTRETTATEMSKLKKQRLLSYANQEYVVDVDKLIELIGEDSFRGLQIKS